MRAVSLGEGDRWVPHHGGRGHPGGIDHRHRALGIGDGQVLVAGHPEQVEPDQQVRRTGTGLDGRVDRPGGDAHVGCHRAALLGQAGLVKAGGEETVEVGGHLQDARDGHHPGPPDTGHAHQQVVGGTAA